MPAQKRHRSNQIVGTPPEFIEAVERRFGALAVDLAALPENAKAPAYITPEQNALTVPWAATYPGAFAWLNPEFADLDPWVAKCRAETSPYNGFRIALLTPASVGTNWFADHIHGKAKVLALSPRLTFVGQSEPYPKDCILSLFGFNRTGFDLWRWR
jgi:phage N-6-adenine-methyltransferase